MKTEVLVVDDDAIILFSLAELLEAEGFYVHSAESAEQAYDLVKKENIKYVFTDLEMPGEHGDLLCKRIKRIKPETWVCAITGNPEAFKEAKDIEADFDDYLPKPFNLDLLIKTINKVSTKKFR